MAAKDKDLSAADAFNDVTEDDILSPEDFERVQALSAIERHPIPHVAEHLKKHDLAVQLFGPKFTHDL